MPLLTSTMLRPMTSSSHAPLPTPTTSTGLKILFLSSDTGGGHRASAESLANQFQRLFPGSTYALFDVVSECAPPPYNSLKAWYKHLSAHPAQWKVVYGVSNTRAYEKAMGVHMRLVAERACRRRIKRLDPDVVVSVHPLMTSVPAISCRKIGDERGGKGKLIPMFTVVTDLNAGHCSWFERDVERIFLASPAMKRLAQERGNVPEDRITMSGLPIRQEFAVQAELLGDRHGSQGRRCVKRVRSELGLPTRDGHAVVLVMGGGEGVGSLLSIVDALYMSLFREGFDATILVVCGRNETLKKQLEKRNWTAILARFLEGEERRDRRRGDTVARRARKSGMLLTLCEPGRAVMSSGPWCLARMQSMPFMCRRSMSFIEDESSANNVNEAEEKAEEELCVDSADKSNNRGQYIEMKTLSSFYEDDSDREEKKQDVPSSVGRSQKLASTALFPSGGSSVTVRTLGYTTQMASYMTASTILLTKAGPGTIAEAAALSLPVLLTSYLPGQEEGNVKFVTENQFGVYVSDVDPEAVASTAARWLRDEEKLSEMSHRAWAAGKPDAAKVIAARIGESALSWREVNCIQRRGTGVWGGEEDEEENEQDEGWARSGSQPLHLPTNREVRELRAEESFRYQEDFYSDCFFPKRST